MLLCIKKPTRTFCLTAMHSFSHQQAGRTCWNEATLWGYTCNCMLTTYKLNNDYCTGWLITCCLTVLVSQSSSCPDTGMGSRGAESLLPERLTAAAEQTNDEPLGLQARDKMLRDTGGTCYYQNLYFNSKYYSLLRDKMQLSCSLPPPSPVYSRLFYQVVIPACNPLKPQTYDMC